jgi:hypothetical protein
VTANENLWLVSADEYDASHARRIAVTRGLEAYGFAVSPIDDGSDPEDCWPDWAVAVYYAVRAAYEVQAIRIVAESHPDVRDAVLAAQALGGSNAVGQLVVALIGYS